MAKKIVFLDRDGTLIEEPADEQIDTLEKYRLLPGVVDGLKRLQDAGYRLVIVSNQDGLGSEKYSQAAYDTVQNRLLKDLTAGGITIDDTLICPHWSADACACRKPKLGLFDAYLADPAIDWPGSFVVGDRATDVELAVALGAQPIHVSRNLEHERSLVPIAERIQAFPPPRAARTERTTKETTIRAAVNLDGHGVGVVKTGLGFFDHMLSALLHHASIDYWITAKGDLEVDEHHTVEDVAIVLGTALSQALGTARGVQRFGFLLPMDESLAQVAIDLGGRPYAVFKAEFNREMVGDLPTELVEHFFYTLAMQLKANIHIELKYSKNAHHAVEAIFKAVGRALRMACELDARHPTRVASTKGVL